MSEHKDVDRLVKLLKEQKKLATKLQALNTEREETLEDLKKIRNQCVELVEAHFRSYLEPKLAKEFPQKIFPGQKTPTTKANVGVTAQFSDLLQDFFLKVLSDDKSRWWQLETPVELRNFVTKALMNKTTSEIRRRSHQQQVGEGGVIKFFDDQLARDVIEKFKAHGVDPGHALELIDRWDDSDNEKLKRHALVLRLAFFGDMEDHQIGSDLENKFDSSSRPLKLNEVAEKIGTPLQTVWRWKEDAIKELRKQLESKIT